MLIAQISDTHIKAPGRLAYRRVDSAAALADCVAAVMALRPRPDLALLTGDLADLGSPEEYAHLRTFLAPLAMPLIAIAGNHDERAAFRAAFADGGYLPSEGFLQFAVEDYPVRILGLDTVVPGQGGGCLCSERLDWLDATLSEAPGVPTVVLMHHPPFRTGIGHMDRIGLKGAEAFAAIMALHPQVERILCGHLHRVIQANVGGRAAMTAPSPSHQVALDIAPDAPSAFRLEPPGFLLHWWNGHGLVSHYVPIGAFDGPYPFFDPQGRLID